MKGLHYHAGEYRFIRRCGGQPKIGVSISHIGESVL
jgi:hypothetical protein